MYGFDIHISYEASKAFVDFVGFEEVFIKDWVLL